MTADDAATSMMPDSYLAKAQVPDESLDAIAHPQR